MKWRGKPAKPAPVGLLEQRFGRARAWGRTDQGAVVVAAPDGLVLDGDPPQLMPWHCIDHAAWTPPRLTVRFRDPDSGVPRAIRIDLAEHGELPPAVRDAVTASVIISRRIPLRGEQGAVVAARRDSSGAIRWTVVFDSGLDPSDPDLQQVARDALAELRQSYGA